MRSRRTVAATIGVALFVTLLGAAKPLVVDDGAFHQYARHIASAPLDPYGFEVFWYQAPQPAIGVLAPPGLLYWWAAGIRVFGDHPVAWKLWLFPLVALLAFALVGLLRIFAPGAEIAGLCLALLSPALLPALNLMLDLPALALSLTAVWLVLLACRGRTALALAAGVVAGIALQTKYTAGLPLLASLVYALLVGRAGVACTVGAISGAIFLGWEIAMWQAYGTSALVVIVTQMATPSGFPQGSPGQWGVAFLCLLGGSSAAVGVLALGAIGTSRRGLLAATAVVAAVFAAVAGLPAAKIAEVGAVFPVLRQAGIDVWLFAGLGAAVLASSAVALRGSPRPASAERHGRGIDHFLWIWLALEIVGFFAISPFPALRRLIGLHVVLVFVACRVVVQREASERQPRLLPAAALFGALLGLLFASSDLLAARARADGVARAAARLAVEAPGATRWFVGHWGFQFEAERRGMRPLVPGVSRVAAGDVVAVPFGVPSQPVHLPRSLAATIDVVRATSAWPWSTLPGSYSGHRPIRPQPGAQLEIHLLRARRDFTAR